MPRSLLRQVILQMPRKGLNLFVCDGKKSSRRVAYGWCLVVCLLVGVVGCKGGLRRSAQHAEVSGTVTYNGKPITGGQIKFVGDDWVSVEGIIDEKGHYTVNAPVGNAKISVDNRMVRTGIRKEAMKGVGKPDAPPPTPIKGTYMQIPDKYYDPTTSELTYVVRSGPQTFDVNLTD